MKVGRSVVNRDDVDRIGCLVKADAYDGDSEEEGSRTDFERGHSSALIEMEEGNLRGGAVAAESIPMAAAAVAAMMALSIHKTKWWMPRYHSQLRLRVWMTN
jgi:hypothetical protein